MRMITLAAMIDQARDINTTVTRHRASPFGNALVGALTEVRETLRPLLQSWFDDHATTPHPLSGHEIQAILDSGERLPGLAGTDGLRYSRPF